MYPTNRISRRHDVFEITIKRGFSVQSNQQNTHFDNANERDENNEPSADTVQSLDTNVPGYENSIADWNRTRSSRDPHHHHQQQEQQQQGQNQRNQQQKPKKRQKPTRPDPFARRPTEKCDPYGHGGKAMSLDECTTLIERGGIIDPSWKVILTNPKGKAVDENKHSEPKILVDEQQQQQQQSLPLHEDCTQQVPYALKREFTHPDFVSGSQFVTHVAAVCQMNNHYASSIQLFRKYNRLHKTWDVVTEVECRTVVLNGLSQHDFMLASLIDIEIQRPEIERLLDS